MRALPNRRFVLRLLAGAATLPPAPARPQEAPRDQGIGGTGMMRTDAPRDPPLGEGDRGIGGTLLSASSYLMKSPPEQREDTEGRARLEAFIRGDEPR